MLRLRKNGFFYWCVLQLLPVLHISGAFHFLVVKPLYCKIISENWLVMRWAIHDKHNKSVALSRLKALQPLLDGINIFLAIKFLWALYQTCIWLYNVQNLEFKFPYIVNTNKLKLSYKLEKASCQLFQPQNLYETYIYKEKPHFATS